MRRADQIESLEKRLGEFDTNNRSLPGLRDPAYRAAFARQLIDSTKRTEYIRLMSGRHLSQARRDPHGNLFDPLLGAMLFQRESDFEEACWMVFLAIHFGKNRSSGWELCRAVYGRNSTGPNFTWAYTSRNVEEFIDWLSRNDEELLRGPPRRAFGNHRKYESLRDAGNRGTPVTVRSYIDWILQAGSHQSTFDRALKVAGGDGRQAFDHLYHTMTVASFGRLAKFDYLSMIGKMGLAPIFAGSTYMSGATGPCDGARLLFFGRPEANASPQSLDQWLVELGDYLGIGMQDLEDALCNWQKSPSLYQQFRG